MSIFGSTPEDKFRAGELNQYLSSFGEVSECMYCKKQTISPAWESSTHNQVCCDECIDTPKAREEIYGE